MADKPVIYPIFELSGPPCEVEGCSGVLVSTICLRTQDHFKKCSKCGTEFYRMTGQEALDWCQRVFNRVLKGEKVN